MNHSAIVCIRIFFRYLAAAAAAVGNGYHAAAAVADGVAVRAAAAAAERFAVQVKGEVTVELARNIDLLCGVAHKRNDLIVLNRIDRCLQCEVIRAADFRNRRYKLEVFVGGDVIGIICLNTVYAVYIRSGCFYNGIG